MADIDGGTPYGADTAAAQAQMQLNSPMVCGIMAGDEANLNWNRTPNYTALSGNYDSGWAPKVEVFPL